MGPSRGFSCFNPRWEIKNAEHSHVTSEGTLSIRHSDGKSSNSFFRVPGQSRLCPNPFSGGSGLPLYLPGKVMYVMIG